LLRIILHPVHGLALEGEASNHPKHPKPKPNMTSLEERWAPESAVLAPWGPRPGMPSFKRSPRRVMEDASPLRNPDGTNICHTFPDFAHGFSISPL